MMKTWKWLLVAGWLTTGAGAIHADAPDKDFQHIVDRPSLIIEELTGIEEVHEAALLILLTLEEIEAADLELDERLERIAETVACAVYTLSAASPEVMLELSPNLREERLTVVTASAMVASPEYAQLIMEALLSGRIDLQERERIEAAAAEPEQHLTRSELRVALRCVPAVRPLPVRPEPIRPLPEDPERTGAARAPRPAPAPAPRYDGQ